MKLLGFAYFDSQEDFEDWQFQNQDKKINELLQNVSEASLYEVGSVKRGDGIFVTYTYEKDAPSIQ